MTFDLIAAPHTPFRPDGTLDLSTIDRQADYFRANGVTGVFVCGTTGEGLSLTDDERRAVVERWVHVKQMPVIAHVGHPSQRGAVELATHAASAGVAGVACVAPFYHRPADEAACVSWLAPIADAARGVPFFFYDIPSVTGVRLRTDRVMQLARNRLPNFAGVKFSNPDLMLLQECLATGQRVLFGIDELLLAAVALGVQGAVGSTYNYMAPLYHRLLSAFAAGDWHTARQLQAKSLEVVRVLDRFGGLAAGKATMSFVGVDCGPVRPPLSPVDTDALRQALDAIGFVSDDRIRS